MTRNADIHPQPMRQTASHDTPAARFARLIAGLLVLVALTSLGLYGFGWALALSLCVMTGIAFVAGRGLLDYPLDALGAANSVTTLRAGMVAVVAGAIMQPEALGWLIFAIATVAFAMDGLDGYLARRSGMATAFGGRFDMEIDALFGAVLSVIILSAGLAGPEILILGFLRYVFVGASYVWPWMNGTLPDSMRRKIVCVIQIGVMIALICPVMPAELGPVIAWGGTLALLWSFGADTLWLKRAAA